MVNFVNSAALSNLQVSGIYIYPQTPAPTVSVGIGFSGLALVGTGGWGDLNTPIPASGASSIYAAIGSYANAGEDEYSLLDDALLASFWTQQLQLIRVDDTTSTAAYLDVFDTGGANGVCLTAICTGADGDLIVYSATVGSQSTEDAPTLTVQIQLAAHGVLETYFNIPNGSDGTFQAALISAINNGIAGSCPKSATVVATQVGSESSAPYTATSPPQAFSGGTNGATFLAPPAVVAAPTIAVVGTTGETEYAYQIVATGDGDAAATASGSTSTGNATLSSDNYNTVTWVAPAIGSNGPITGYKILRQVGGTGSFEYLATVAADTVTFEDNGQYEGSSYTTVSTVTASDAQFGMNELGSRTGLYAALGSGVLHVGLCGNVDSDLYNELQTFAQAYGMLAFGTLPSGTSISDAISTKQAANFTSPYGVCLKDWLYITDPSTQQAKLVSPLGEEAGCIASLAPWVDPTNLPQIGFSNILGTEQGGPYSYAEMAELQAAGILYASYGIPRSPGLLGFPHGENASASVVGLQATTDNISYTRMTIWLSASIVQVLGPFVGELQGSSATDPVRSSAKTALVQFLQGLQINNAIDSYQVTLDLTNNTPITMAAGFCVALVQVAYMNTIKFFLVNLVGGSAVQVGLGNIPTTLAA